MTDPENPKEAEKPTEPKPDPQGRTDPLAPVVGADGRTYIKIPMQIYSSAVIPLGAQGPFDVLVEFTPRPGTSAVHVHDLTENEVMEYAVDLELAREFILQEVGLDPSHAWCLIQEDRKTLVPERPSGKPGDFDLIAGPIRDGLIAFDYLASVEVKLRKVDAGWGASFDWKTSIEQATGAAVLGFDRVLLLHVLPNEARDLPPGYSPSWSPIKNASCYDAMVATANKLKGEIPADAPYGYALLGWGLAPGYGPLERGATSPIPLIPCPVRPLQHREDVVENREALLRGIRQRIGERRPAARLLRTCKRCGSIFAPPNGRRTACCA